MADIRRICVVGAGTMGHGIAQVAATSGYQVVMHDVEDRFLRRGMENIRTGLARAIKAGRIGEGDSQALLGRINTTVDLNVAAKNADLVIEAVPELLDLKRDVFRRLDAICRPEVILATNTSQLSISAIASATQRPDRVVGMHWFNPPQVMKLIEIVRGIETSEETVNTITRISATLGKETVVCRDSQGFITSRAIGAFMNECARILEEGIATKEDIDKAIRLGFNHPMGPFELADMVGVDVMFHSSLSLSEVIGERFRPPQLVRQMVAAGRLGRKTGKGYYDYTGKETTIGKTTPANSPDSAIRTKN